MQKSHFTSVVANACLTLWCRILSRLSVQQDNDDDDDAERLMNDESSLRQTYRSLSSHLVTTLFISGADASSGAPNVPKSVTKWLQQWMKDSNNSTFVTNEGMDNSMNAATILALDSRVTQLQKFLSKSSTRAVHDNEVSDSDDDMVEEVILPSTRTASSRRNNKSSRRLTITARRHSQQHDDGHEDVNSLCDTFEKTNMQMQTGILN